MPRLDLEQLRDLPRDGGAMRGDARRLREQRESAFVTVRPRARSIASTCRTNTALSASRQCGSLSLKVLADVAEPGGAEQRIAQRVQQHIAVGVRHHAVRVGHAHAAEHDEVPRSEGVHVRTETDAHVS